MPEFYSGNCACGGIKFEIEKTKGNVVNCHCNKCRELNGGPFSTYFVVPEKRFKLIEGRELLKSYSPSEKAVKNFCGNCGTPIFNLNLKYPTLKIVYYGGINFLEEKKPNMNIFCQSKLSWVEIDTELANYEAEIQDA